MVRKLPSEVRKKVVQLWLDGNSYSGIHHKAGPSTGASSSIISQLRKEVPEIDELRNLNIALRNAGGNLADALKGARFLSKLNQLNIQTVGVATCISLLDRYGEKAGEVLESGQRLKELEVSQGKTCEQIIHDAMEKVKQLKDAEASLGNLRRREETIKNSLQDLERLKALNEKITSVGLKPEHLDWYINHSIRLQQLGFPLQTAELLASELAKLGLSPQDAAAKLPSLLSQYGSLVTAVAKLQKENDRLNKDVERKKTQQEGVTKQLEASKKQVEDHRRLIKDEEASYRGRTEQFQKECGLKQKELEAEIQSLKEEREYVANSIQELKKEREAVQASLDRTQDAFKKIEERLAKDRLLATLALLIEEPRSQAESTTVLKVSTSFIEALKEHIDANPQLVSSSPAVISKLNEIGRTFAVECKLATRRAL